MIREGIAYRRRAQPQSLLRCLLCCRRTDGDEGTGRTRVVSECVQAAKKKNDSGFLNGNPSPSTSCFICVIAHPLRARLASVRCLNQSLKGVSGDVIILVSLPPRALYVHKFVTKLRCVRPQEEAAYCDPGLIARVTSSNPATHHLLTSRSCCTE